MESYPKELLEGVSPLIFAVDAVLTKNDNKKDAANWNQKSNIFESFYNSIASQTSTQSLTTLQSQSPSSSSSPSRKKSFPYF